MKKAELMKLLKLKHSSTACRTGEIEMPVADGLFVSYFEMFANKFGGW